MARTIPYLQRRGDTFGFRMVVPADLQPFLSRREFTQTLKTSDRSLAVQRSLSLAAECKQLFHALRNMSQQEKEQFLTKYVVEISMDEFGRKKITGSAEPHETEAFNQAMESAIKTISEVSAPRLVRLQSVAEDVIESPNVNALSLSTAVDEFLDSYPKENRAMLKKHQTCLEAFRKIVGEKLVSQLRRTDVKEFFDVLQALPPRWSDLQRKTGVSLRELAEQDHAIRISKKTFQYTYKTSISQFLTWGKETYGDEGFPEIQITQIKYNGTRTKAERKQRPFTITELKRLFEGPEMQSFLKDPKQVHQFWLPLIGLYTGARVNEICQINPQVDIKQDADTGIWFFHLTEDTAADANIEKSIKSGIHRDVPIHSQLIELGLLRYLEQMRKSGKTRIFPLWKPSRGRASSQAEKWFRGFMGEIGLRDTTPGATLLGMHAFRHTLCNAAQNAQVVESQIVGHADSSVSAGYRGQMSLKTKQEIIEKIQFPLSLKAPVDPCTKT